MRLRPSPAMVVALIALFAALGGSSFAEDARQAASRLITGKQIKNRSIGVADLSTAARSSLRGRRGAPGAPGPRGAPGVPGVPGPKGDTGTVDVSRFYTKGESDSRFLGSGAKAADADRLDGLDSADLSRKVHWALVAANGLSIIAQSGGIEIGGASGGSYFVDFNRPVAGRGLVVTKSQLTNQFAGTILARPCDAGPEGGVCNGLTGAPDDVNDGEHVFVNSQNAAHNGQATHAFYIALLP